MGKLFTVLAFLYAGYWFGSKTPEERQRVMDRIGANAPSLFTRESSGMIAPVQISLPRPWTGYYS
mgnify:CR=1 FL=1